MRARLGPKAPSIEEQLCMSETLRARLGQQVGSPLFLSCDWKKRRTKKKNEMKKRMKMARQEVEFSPSRRDES